MEKSLAFVHYILGLIDASPNGLDEVKTNLVKEKLQDLFVHEIDPSYGFSESEKKEADKIHSPIEFENDLTNINNLNDLTNTTNLRC